jgi:hypothetical protein
MGAVATSAPHENQGREAAIRSSSKLWNSEVLYGISTECISPAYRIAFLKKALRNLSKAFSFF